jgi:ribulose-bisphosphate carboxylase large chain
LPHISAPANEIFQRARLARNEGAGGLLICPGLVGWDAMRHIADDDEVALPIMSHPALLGSWTMHASDGISHHALYGQIPRLAGADAVIFPNYGGRFSFSEEQCQEIISGTEVDMQSIAPIYPAPAGGMTLARVPELCRFYGRQSVLLVGGDLHRTGATLVENCQAFRRLVEASFAD